MRSKKDQEALDTMKFMVLVLRDQLKLADTLAEESKIVVDYNIAARIAGASKLKEALLSYQNGRSRL